MNGIIKILCGIGLISISSCSSYHPIYSRSPAVQSCKMACLSHYQLCKKQCVDNCAKCSAKSAHSSSTQFLHYDKQQGIQGMAVNRELNSYKDPLQCLKISCDCAADLDVCKQGCTGIVQKQLIAKPMPQCT